MASISSLHGSPSAPAQLPGVRQGNAASPQTTATGSTRPAPQDTATISPEARALLAQAMGGAST